MYSNSRGARDRNSEFEQYAAQHTSFKLRAPSWKMASLLQVLLELGVSPSCLSLLLAAVGYVVENE